MKIILAVIINLATGCCSPDKSISTDNKNNSISAISSKGSLIDSDSTNKKLSDTMITIAVSYAAIECGCPQWFEAKFKDVKFLEGVERFYLEPIRKDLVSVNDLWDGEHLPLTLKIAGRFSKEKEMPVTYHTKGIPEKARIFWYDTITILSQPKK